MGLLSDRNGFVVTTTIESLSRINGDLAKSALLQMLEHDDREVRRTAIKALSSFDDVEGELLPFLKDGDWATRKAAAEALGKNPQGAVKKELERLLDSEEDPIVKKVVEDSLKKHSMVVGQ
jgi:HEAT repeat protein